MQPDTETESNTIPSFYCFFCARLSSQMIRHTLFLCVCVCVCEGVRETGWRPQSAQHLAQPTQRQVNGVRGTP